MSKMVNNVPEQKKARKGIAELVGLFALVVLCVFPVVYDNFYFNILETKYRFYSIAAIAMIALAVVYGLYTNKLIDWLRETSLKKIVKSLNVVDWSVILFWFANVISWLGCLFRWEAFWGTSGRYNGVFLMTIYMVVYFIVTRCMKLKRVYLDAFLAVSIFVCLFGITDFFQMDLLGFKENMLEKQKHIYTSTLGNINTYTIYVGAVLCVSMMLFVLETNVKRGIYYFGVMVIAMVALIVGTSDNAYLTLAALFGFSPLYLFRSKVWLRKYLASVASFLSAIVFVGWISKTYAGVVYELDSIFKILSNLSIVPIAAAVLWIVVLLWAVKDMKSQKKSDDALGKWAVGAWMALIAIVAAVVLYVLYDANIAGNAEKYEAVKNYVVYNENWGTNRGFVWNASLELYANEFNLFQKLFGYGSDTFMLIMTQHYPPMDGYVYDSAHNEYLHFLVTIGFVGMASYISIMVSAVVSMARRLKNRPEAAAIMFMVLAYMTQAVVNINLPVIFPLIWLLLAMGLCKEPDEKTGEK